MATCYTCTKPAKYSKMFCTAKHAASHAVEMLETTCDYAWCHKCNRWLDGGLDFDGRGNSSEVECFNCGALVLLVFDMPEPSPPVSRSAPTFTCSCCNELQKATRINGRWYAVRHEHFRVAPSREA